LRFDIESKSPPAMIDVKPQMVNGKWYSSSYPRPAERDLSHTFTSRFKGSGR
jgi:hypothetical protein